MIGSEVAVTVRGAGGVYVYVMEVGKWIDHRRVMLPDDEESSAARAFGFQVVDCTQRVIEAGHDDVLQFVAQRGVDHRFLLRLDLDVIREGAEDGEPVRRGGVLQRVP